MRDLWSRFRQFCDQFDAEHRGVVAALGISAGIVMMAFALWWSEQRSGQCDTCSEGEPWEVPFWFGLAVFIGGLARLWRILRRRP